ncbi:adenylate/guanylate cyclase domain-containing protein [Variovorax ginsengisoli]|uniref:Adenylate/guanylate cyclase domain-containing protein n=1 Tax=Variovorax ginsengisoli TaxID=363844 RepID=A0ABT8RWV3_9BURK|nr:adenylate/guanylate cyclase domain-containing protein [Variovorax ginsengisoli]MDN8611946.1 adenylate/guanylate cyclase domain-containing protein [Variovorax ginsengisoli]MDO1531116.1 adenylate/guanylate cyclase domain-containing protein [Variovorax ginsengisoli]
MRSNNRLARVECDLHNLPVEKMWTLDRIHRDLERVVRAVLVVDVVESVRLIQEDEGGAIQRWRTYSAEVADRLVPAYGGRLVKSLGDGLMIEFPSAPSAVQAALALQQLSLASNIGLADRLKMRVRIGVHIGPLIADARDIYGHGVNLTARLATLAGPDEIVVSADVRDQLVPGVDADIEDLGECYLKHVTNPVRAFRVGVPGERPLNESDAIDGDLKATVAVIPFLVRGVTAGSSVLGQALVDDVITALSRSQEINVVSRLSTISLGGRKMTLDALALHLNADYLVSGSLVASGEHLRLKTELAEAKSRKVVWSKTLRGTVKGVIAGKDELADRLVSDICNALMAHELQRATGKALATLESRTLLLASINLMHRISPLAFHRAQQMLEALIERSPRLAAPYAWLAKSYVLRVTQGWSDDALADGRRALENTRRALDRDPTLSLAMTVEGQVNTYILKHLDVAQDRYEAALNENPNDSLAWLLKGTLHAFRDEGKEAVRHTRQALRLSPLDPLKYYFDSLAATAALSAGQYPRAVSLAQASLRLNRVHTSTLRALITALWELGREDEAREAARDLLKIDPNFKVSAFMERSPAAPFQLGRVVARALQSAGIPQ